MRICYIANSQLPSQFANSVHVVNMAAALASIGEKVTLLAQKGKIDTQHTDLDEIIFHHYGVEANFHIDWMPNPVTRGRSLFAALSAWAKLRILEPDLVIGRHGKGCFASVLNGLPTIYETHKPFSAHSAGDRFCLDRLFRSASFRGLVTISKPLKESLVMETNLPASRILVAPDAAQVPIVLHPASLGGRGRLQVGYIGGFYSGRGIDLLLAVAAQLPEMDFHLVGGTRSDLAKWLGETAEQPNVQFHGYQPPSRAAELRAGCDVLVAPYSRATMIENGIETTAWMSPLKIFEYMASAKPILCSDLPVLHEVLEHERNALLLSPDDPEPWVAALRRLQAEPGFSNALGARAYEDFEANYTWRQRAERIVSFGKE